MPDPFADLLAANRRYADNFELGELTAPAARQLGVVTCIDSRIEPLGMLGLVPGDAKILRNAGAEVTDDVIRSLELATKFLDVRRIMVVIHTNCAAPGVTDERLLRDLDVLRTCGRLADGVVIGGFEYDVRTGLLREVG